MDQNMIMDDQNMIMDEKWSSRWNLITPMLLATQIDRDLI
jgi:hypothetical protein